VSATAVALVAAAGAQWTSVGQTALSKVRDILSLTYEFTVYPSTGCNNFQEIAYLEFGGQDTTLEECANYCSVDPECVSFNYQPGVCPVSQFGSGLPDYCVIFHGECEMGSNGCFDLHVRTPAMPPEPNVTTATTCSVISDRTNMAVISTPAYDGVAPFPSFHNAQEEATYECVSWTATSLNCGTSPCTGTASLRDTYPMIVGSPACAAIRSILGDEALLENCSQFSELSSVRSRLRLEVIQVCAVGGWFSQTSSLYDAILRQQQVAFDQAMDLLDMKTSMYVEPPESPEGGGVPSWVTGTLGSVTTILGMTETFSAVSEAMEFTSFVLGDALKISAKFAPDEPLTWAGQQLFNEQAAAAEAYNSGHLQLQQLLTLVDGLLRAIQEIFKEQAMIIAADAGRLAGAYEITMACPISTSSLLLQVANTKQAQLWRGLVLLMPTRYAIYIQRDMGISGPAANNQNKIVSNPPCFDSFAEPRPTLADYVTSGQNLDWCDSQDNVADTPFHFQKSRTVTGGFSPPVFTPDACASSSRRIWLGIVGSPSQLAPDTFWEALGGSAGLIPTFINSVFDLTIEPGAESAWRTMLGQCENITRSYSPELSSVGSNQWSGGMQGWSGWERLGPAGRLWGFTDITTVGWSVISSSDRDTDFLNVVDGSPWTEMKTASALSGVCKVFGIPLQVRPLPDCRVTSVMFNNQPNVKPSAGPFGNDRPTCINGFSLSTAGPSNINGKPNPIEGPFAQLTSFSQNGLVPTGCADSIVVTGAASFSLLAVGRYDKCPQQHENRPVYRQTRTGRVIYFSGSQQAWIVGADLVGGQGLTITYVSEAGEVPTSYRSDTPCPILGQVSADASNESYASLNNLSTTTLTLTNPLPNPYPPQVKTCCVPWRDTPSDCKHAVCDCNALYGLVSVRMISREKYQRWLGQCAYCKFYGEDGGLADWAGGVDVTTNSDGSDVFTGGCGLMTSAGPLGLVLQGNIDSPPPA
jgi:hypothetical protein